MKTLKQKCKAVFKELAKEEEDYLLELARDKHYDTKEIK